MTAAISKNLKNLNFKNKSLKLEFLKNEYGWARHAQDLDSAVFKVGIDLK